MKPPQNNLFRYERPSATSLIDDDLGMVVDNFAGGGGASTGIEAAIGRPCDLAVNHDPQAIAMHEVNHPDTRHLCESVWDIDPLKVTGGRTVGLAWFSPDCTYFSKARGGKPQRDEAKKVRGLAWVVIKWAKAVKPRVIMLENVEEFRHWGPLKRDGQPCKRRRGQTFDQWVGALRAEGYEVDWKELRACDYGAPTIRKRLFLIARCDGRPIVWPAATHGKAPLLPYRTAAECIDWSLPCPSIFERRRPLVEKTLTRIATGIRRYVIDAQEPFIVTCNHGGDWFRGQGISEPFKTVTGSRDAHGLVSPILSQYHSQKGDESRCGSPNDPINTLDTQNRFGLVSAFLAKHFGGAVGAKVTRPFPTITQRGVQNQVTTAYLNRICQNGSKGKRVSDVRDPLTTITSKNEHCVTAAFLSHQRGSNTGGGNGNLDKPLNALTAGGNHIAEVRAFLIQYYSHGSGKTGRAIDKPAPTIPTKHRLGLVTISGIEYQIIDIGMRMLQPRELFRCQGFPDDYVIDPINPATSRAFTKTLQIKMCGNSVSPQMSEALVRANVAAPENYFAKGAVA